MRPGPRIAVGASTALDFWHIPVNVLVVFAQCTWGDPAQPPRQPYQLLPSAPFPGTTTGTAHTGISPPFLGVLFVCLFFRFYLFKINLRVLNLRLLWINGDIPVRVPAVGRPGAVCPRSPPVSSHSSLSSRRHCSCFGLGPGASLCATSLFCVGHTVGPAPGSLRNPPEGPVHSQWTRPAARRRLTAAGSRFRIPVPIPPSSRFHQPPTGLGSVLRAGHRQCSQCAPWGPSRGVHAHFSP